MDDDRADMGRTPLADNAPLSLIGAANGISGATDSRLLQLMVFPCVKHGASA